MEQERKSFNNMNEFQGDWPTIPIKGGLCLEKGIANEQVLKIL